MPNPSAREALRTGLCDRFGIEYPIFAFAHSLEVVAAVTEAGGFGVWGATRNTPEEIADGLTALHARLGGKPFGVDLVLPRGMPAQDDREAIEREIPAEHRAFVQDLRDRYGVPQDGGSGMRSRFVRSEQMAQQQIEAVLASPVAMFAMGIGSPPETIRRAKASGKTVASLVGAPRHARRALEMGADLLVAQGYDAGAHTGTVGTFSLIPRIVDIAGDVPVLAAGGVATGRHIAASLALGAAGVWTGTAWLATHEHAVASEIVAKLLEADVDATVISQADSGKTLRQIKTKWSQEWAADGAPTPLRMPYQDLLVGDLLGAVDRHRVEPLMHIPAGQSVGYVTGVDSVAEVMSRLVAESRGALEGLAGRPGRKA